MIKTLILDVDRSCSVLGGYPGVEKLLGIKPIPISGGGKQILSLFERLFDKVPIKNPHPLFGDLVEELQYIPKQLVKDAGLQCIVIDTASHAFTQDMMALESKRPTKQLEMQDWGALERCWNELLSAIKFTPIPVIVNAHMKYDKDELGIFHWAPALKGATNSNMAGYFDAIFYTKPDKSGKKIYSWQTVADNSRGAKTRVDLDANIVQDFSVVFKKYAEANFPNPKILVLGESGTGKTRALETLSKL